MNWREFLFGGWEPIARTVIVGVLAYVALVVLLRVSGKRSLSKFNAFDFVVTIAIGSTLATILLSRDVSLAQGVTAFAMLLGLQYVITWLSVRSERVEGIVKSEPTLLLLRGEFLDDAMRRARVTRDEVATAARSQGIPSLADVEAAVLETDGTVTVVEGEADRLPSSLADVDGYPAHGGDAVTG